MRFYGILSRSQLGKCFKGNWRNFSSPVRVRFAPSPTGQLHLGSLRTAFINYLFAKKEGGAFILRIEDTDQSRLVEGTEQKIESTLEHLGLVPDESPTKGGAYVPYRQSERLKYYNHCATHLINSGDCYRCFCTPERLDMVRRISQQEKRRIIGYDGHCKSITLETSDQIASQGKPFTVRLKLPNEVIRFDDIVHGIHANNIAQVEGDPILLKSDGFPTYHLANVVDDHKMDITHVIRGEEWLDATLKHKILYDAFGWNLPKFAHLPLIMSKGGGKLSKRFGDTQVGDFLAKGYSPNVILNFVTRGGGGFLNRDENQVYPLDALVSMFDLKLLNGRNVQCDFTWLTQFSVQNIKNAVNDAARKKVLIDKIRKLVAKKFYDGADKIASEKLIHAVLSEAYIESVLIHTTANSRLEVLDQIVSDQFQYFWTVPHHVHHIMEYYPLHEAEDILGHILGYISKTDLDWESFIQGSSEPDKSFKKFSLEHNLNFSKLMRFLRVCLTGSDVGLPIHELLHIFGKDMTVVRMQHALSLIQDNTTRKPQQKAL